MFVNGHDAITSTQGVHRIMTFLESCLKTRPFPKGYIGIGNAQVHADITDYDVENYLLKTPRLSFAYSRLVICRGITSVLCLKTSSADTSD